ncbi:unnamed protein product [Mytilus coruscus]|uniref:Tyr recombinase domain-containing protein n=1 Tax=Mytilus coruscus TaxID=42192 RepID=A0A6J8DFQ6_MYTCO|nr:unnamed protein product [Mytilus coruscus]
MRLTQIPHQRALFPITMAESVHQQRSSVSNGEMRTVEQTRTRLQNHKNTAQCFAGLQETFKLLINRDNTHDKSREFYLQQWYDHAGIGNRSETCTSIRGNYQGQGNTENASFISGTQIGNFSCGKPLERQYFLTCIKKVLDLCGFNSSHYNGHSFRIGAATSAGKAKIEDHLIKTLGRWSSDSYIRYIRVTPASIKSAQNSLGRI